MSIALALRLTVLRKREGRLAQYWSNDDPPVRAIQLAVASLSRAHQPAARKAAAVSAASAGSIGARVICAKRGFSAFAAAVSKSGRGAEEDRPRAERIPAGIGLSVTGQQQPGRAVAVAGANRHQRCIAQHMVARHAEPGRAVIGRRMRIERGVERAEMIERRDLHGQRHGARRHQSRPITRPAFASAR